MGKLIPLNWQIIPLNGQIIPLIKWANKTIFLTSRPIIFDNNYAPKSLVEYSLSMPLFM